LKLTITPTDRVVNVDGVPVRIWEGVTTHGAKCTLFIHRIAVHVAAGSEELDRSLTAVPAPSRVGPSPSRPPTA
jgi:hypothetical protein